MTHQEILTSVNSLPPEEQFALANQILDGLAESGRWPLDDEMKKVLDDRAKRSDENPESQVPANRVFAKLRSQLKAS